jgi:tRNA (guanine37-N1)-methyltransferase
MLGLKVPLKDAEKWKDYLLEKGLFDKTYYYLKDKEYIYFPVTQRFDELKGRKISFVDKDFPKSTRKGTLKENLSGSLTKEELAFVKTAHDTIGTIAILEIPKDLEKREKLIAETLLKVNPQVKTVLKKADIHGGVFRTQKMTYLAGIDTKETVYKENNVVLKLDVEKVYFSVRLSNERKRIMELVRPGEEILVMFSGCAPYPAVLSKNTKARHITGIEINPDGHKYGLENLRLNKINNVLLINGDVHDAIPKIYQKIIGLKTSPIKKEMISRLALNPSIIEFHLFDDSLDDDNIKSLEKAIMELKQKGIEIYIHIPFKINEEYYDLSSDNVLSTYKKMGELCKKYSVSAIMHLANEKDISNEMAVIEKIKTLEQYYDYFYFENLTEGFNTKEKVMKISKMAGFKNICIDLAHLYITYGDNKKIESAIRYIQKDFNTYFHVADHDKKLHTCEIGTGLIDFDKILPLINKGVIEVSSKDETNPVEALKSYDTLKKYHNKTYDRIIMPLPKTADEFLDDALSVAKKGTIVHFYDFLEVSKFDEAIKKIDVACKKRKMRYKVHGTFKCGQHAPYVFRICVDFEIV